MRLKRMFKHVLRQRTKRVWTWGPVSEHHVPLDEIDSADSHTYRTVMELICHSSARREAKEFLLDNFMRGFLFAPTACHSLDPVRELIESTIAWKRTERRAVRLGETLEPCRWIQPPAQRAPAAKERLRPTMSARWLAGAATSRPLSTSSRRSRAKMHAPRTQRCASSRPPAEPPEKEK